MPKLYGNFLNILQGNWVHVNVFIRCNFKPGMCMKTISIVVLAAMMALPAIAQDQVVATVNGKNITKKQFEEYHLQNLKFVGTRKITKEVSLRDLVNRELAIQKAKKTGLDKSPDVVAKQEDILFHAQVSKDLENEFKKIVVCSCAFRCGWPWSLGTLLAVKRVLSQY